MKLVTGDCCMCLDRCTGLFVGSINCRQLKQIRRLRLTVLSEEAERNNFRTYTSIVKSLSNLGNFTCREAPIMASLIDKQSLHRLVLFKRCKADSVKAVARKNNQNRKREFRRHIVASASSTAREGDNESWQLYAVIKRQLYILLLSKRKLIRSWSMKVESLSTHNQ